MSTQSAIIELKQFVAQHIIGQERLVDRLLIALLADGHLLVEGPPGLAKTRAIKVLGDGIECDFHRIQFTPDLLPADLTGTEVYRPQDGQIANLDCPRLCSPSLIKIQMNLCQINYLGRVN